MVAAPTSTGELHSVGPRQALGLASSLALSCACSDDLRRRGRLSDGLLGLFEFFQMGWRFADEAICRAAKLPDAFAE